MTCTIRTATFVLLTLCAGHAIAQPFGLGSDEWDGYGTFTTMLGRPPVALTRVEQADLAALGEHDLLVLVEPSAPLPVEQIALWVEQGGHLLVLDESGGGDDLAARFGLERVDVPPPSSPFLGNTALPRLRPVGRHPISEGIDHIVANHPSALRGPGLPVFATGPDSGVVWDTTLGEGRAVFVADPSLFIALMLPLAGNARLVENLVGYLCDGGCSATIVEAGGSVEGSATRTTAGIDDALERLADTLSDLRTIRIDDRAMLAASVLLLTGAIAILLATMPISRHVPRPTVPAVPGRSPRGEFEFGVGRYRGRLREQNFALPAATLADAFETIFYPRLGMSAPPADSQSPVYESVAGRFTERWLSSLNEGARRRRARQVARVLEQVARSPRGEAVFTGAESVDEATFNALHRDLTTILREMGATDEYERRFARPE